MINIIDHIWQAEIRQFSILPTLIRFHKEKAKCYFYSCKQGRVLRKKQQSIESSIQLMINGCNKNQNYLLISTRNVKQVQFSFILQNQMRQIASDCEGNCIVVRLDQSFNGNMVIQCLLDVSGHFQAKILLVYQKALNYWRRSGIQANNMHILKKFVYKLWNELPVLLKVKSKCEKIELMVSITQKMDVINIIWCNEFVFSGKEFYQIEYRYLMKEMQGMQGKQIISNKHQMIIIDKIDHKIQSIQKQLNIQQNIAQIKIICKGCENMIIQSKCKQVSNIDVISLRRKHKLSIFGILDQYLFICEKCYYQIDDDS